MERKEPKLSRLIALQTAPEDKNSLLNSNNTVEELTSLGFDINGNHVFGITLEGVQRCCTVAPEGRAGFHAFC